MPGLPRRLALVPFADFKPGDVRHSSVEKTAGGGCDKPLRGLVLRTAGKDVSVTNPQDPSTGVQPSAQKSTLNTRFPRPPRFQHQRNFFNFRPEAAQILPRRRPDFAWATHAKQNQQNHDREEPSPPSPAGGPNSNTYLPRTRPERAQNLFRKWTAPRVPRAPRAPIPTAPRFPPRTRPQPAQKSPRRQDLGKPRSQNHKRDHTCAPGRVGLYRKII